ncbi:site-specific DNA-methyltransferase [Helicobacter suis]|uniref:site-specific DNA-methyltransferase n=1 Tax=Helicobacter suis TaxID=104628 RepID=UPI001F07FA5A|nr:site-specific DNA-methyltransferase [Helicobacter suis]
MKPTKLQEYTEKIKEILDTSFNADQKKLALEILEKADSNNLEAIFSLLTKRIDVGFVFDIAPEIQHDAICLLKHDTKLSFTPDPCTQTHAMIFGENYDALKNLLVLYRGCVDCIYIDPPYNTESTKQDGNDYKSKENTSGKFGYRDKFMRTGWLNMLNERLKLAKDLLSPNGVIFISIDDSEQAYLKVLCDGIFGERNFVACIAYQGLDTIKNDAQYFSCNHEYILCYAKEKQHCKIKGVKRTEKHNKVYKNPDHDERGAYLLTPLHAKSGTESNIYTFTFKNGVKWTPPIGTYPRFSQQTLVELENDNRIYFGKKGDAIPQKKTFLGEVAPYVKLTTFWSYEFVGSTRQANNDLEILGLKGLFTTPKPVKLLRTLVDSVTSPNSLILDFYAGSGTTGQAVMELNREDGGNRRCILVTSNENNIAKGVMYERIYRICHGVGTKNETFEWTKKNEPFKDQGWEVFKMDRHNLKIDDQQKAENLAKQAEKSFKILRPGFTFESDFDLYHSLSSLKPYK